MTSKITFGPMVLGAKGCLGVLRTFLKRFFGRLFSIPEGSICFSQTPSGRPPHVTGRLLNTVP